MPNVSYIMDFYPIALMEDKCFNSRTFFSFLKTAVKVVYNLTMTKTPSKAKNIIVFSSGND